MKSNKRTILAGLALTVSFVGLGPLSSPIASAQDSKGCFVDSEGEKGRTLTVYSADGSSTAYGPEDEGITTAKEIIEKYGLAPCEETPAPALPFDQTGVSLAAVTLGAGAIVARRARNQRAGQNR